MGFMKKLVAACFAVAWMTCAWAQQAEPPLVLKFQTHASESSAQWQGMLKPWIEQIETQSKGRIKFERDPELAFGGKPADLYEQLRDGKLDVVWTNTGLVPGQFSRVAVFELPFMMTTPPAVSRALWEYVETYAVDEFKDLHLLALNVQGEGVLHTREKPIKRIDDFEGLTLQVQPRLIGRFFEALGAKPLDLAADQMDQKWRDLSVDGFAGTWESASSYKPERAIKHHMVFGPDTGALYTQTYMLAMNLTRYESLPAELKAIIDANAGAELSAEFGSLTQAHTDAQRAAVLAGSDPGALIEIDGQTAQAFRRASMKVDQSWVEEIDKIGYEGQKLLDGARTLIKQHTK